MYDFADASRCFIKSSKALQFILIFLEVDKVSISKLKVIHWWSTLRYASLYHPY